MSNYSKLWSSKEPGYLIFLLDASGSMGNIYEADKSRLEYASLVINNAIKEICLGNMNGAIPKDRAHISIITYNNTVEVQVSDYMSKIYQNPKDTKKVKKKVPDGAGGLIEIDVEIQNWIDVNLTGVTRMAEAFRTAKELIHGWIREHTDGPAPIIINVSDGMPYDGISEDDSKFQCIQEVLKIKDIQIVDGAPLIFNAHIGERGSSPCKYPTSNDNLGEQARFLFEISSDIPESLMQAAKAIELEAVLGSKGMISNADPVELVKFITFGSSPCGNRDLGEN